jgi:hypothetical protein
MGGGDECASTSYSLAQYSRRIDEVLVRGVVNHVISCYIICLFCVWRKQRSSSGDDLMDYDEEEATRWLGCSLDIDPNYLETRETKTHSVRLGCTVISSDFLEGDWFATTPLALNRGLFGAQPRTCEAVMEEWFVVVVFFRNKRVLKGFWSLLHHGI